MKNYWIQALLLKNRNGDYRYDAGDRYWQKRVICDNVVHQMIRRKPKYLRLTLSTRPLKDGSQWKVVKGNFGNVAKNLKTGQHHLMFGEMEDWLKTLDSDTFWVTVEAVDAATYRKGL